MAKWAVPPSQPPPFRSKWALARSTTLLVAVALVALIFMGALAQYQVRDFAETAALTRHTEEVLAQIAIVRAKLDQIPAATRGYALTGQARFLETFDANIAGLDDQLQHLQALTENPRQQERIARLKRQIAERIQAGRAVVAARRNGGAEAAKALVASDRGDAMIQEIHKTLMEMDISEHELLRQREQASETAGKATFAVLPAGTLVSLLVLALGVFRLNKEALAVRDAHENATMELLDSISDGFIALDPLWRYVRINTAGLKLLGKTREEMVGKEIWEVFPQTSACLYDREFRRAVREGVPVQFEEFYPRIGGWFEIRAYPNRNGVNLFFNDITKRKQTEERLRQLSRAVEQSASVVMITDTQGRIEYVNSKFSEVTGFSAEEVLGQNPKILRSEESIPDQGRDLWQSLRAGREWRGEFRNRKKNGELYWEYASISPITDEQGRTTHYIAVKEDITRRKAMESSLVEAKQQAEEASQTKDIFLATLSHELRTPLTPVLLTASSAEADETLDHEVREQFRVIRASIELESRLIDDLLDITKISRGKFSLNVQPFDVSEPLGKTLEMLRQDYTAKNLQVDWAQEADAVTLCADMARLHQVFWNILKNAIKFTPPGGSIHIRTTNPDPDWLAIEVRDTGIGIAPDFLREVFQPFQQGAASGKAQFGGLGLGLAITKTIVERHGGSIRVSSAGVGQGSTFTVEMPLWKGVVKPPAEPEDMEVAARSLLPKRILLVEDDKWTRTVLARLLEKGGHEVLTAGSCAEADSLLGCGETRFEILLCDLGLPDGNGLELIAQVRAHSPKVAAIAISGYGMAEDIRRSRDAGFDAHLVKPVSIEELRATLARVA